MGWWYDGTGRRPSTGSRRQSFVIRFRDPLRGVRRLPRPGEQLQGRCDVLVADLLGDEFEDAQSLGVASVGLLVGGGQNDDGSGLELRLFPQPAKEIDSVHSRHVDVRQNDVGEGRGGGTQIFEVGNGFGTVPDARERFSEAFFGQSAFEEEHVVGIVLDQENAKWLQGCRHRVTAPGSQVSEKDPPPLWQTR
jgi:hypothetical protein